MAKGQIIAPDPETMSIFWNLLNWPSEHVFPALDVARLAILHKHINDLLSSENLMPVIERHTASDALAANQMLTFRLLANMFNHEKGEALGLLHVEDILQALLRLSTLGSKNNQVSLIMVFIFFFF